MPCEFPRACTIDNFTRGTRHFIRELTRQENWRLRNSKIGWPLLRCMHATQKGSVFFRREICVKARAKLRIHFEVGMALRAIRLISLVFARFAPAKSKLGTPPRGASLVSDEKLPALHDLLAVEPDVEIAADAVDMSFRNPVCAGVLGIRMTKGNVDARNFFVL